MSHTLMRKVCISRMSTVSSIIAPSLQPSHRPINHRTVPSIIAPSHQSSHRPINHRTVPSTFASSLQPLHRPFNHRAHSQSTIVHPGHGRFNRRVKKSSVAMDGLYYYFSPIEEKVTFSKSARGPQLRGNFVKNYLPHEEGICGILTLNE
ncbi:hypothetical protein POVCU2_0035210 [Plasmodium ovale curtisi]|uniref:Uncharacterized protein n=1 Tax=Plasmodium ovale curtisi TaxID=864141 RepID=A0A1A8VZR7_PLAOA|nr:hypothetical protein POVCU2_0035210 [Plasmodium ovale curtisi]